MTTNILKYFEENCCPMKTITPTLSNIILSKFQFNLYNFYSFHFECCFWIFSSKVNIYGCENNLFKTNTNLCFGLETKMNTIVKRVKNPQVWCSIIKTEFDQYTLLIIFFWWLTTKIASTLHFLHYVKSKSYQSKLKPENRILPQNYQV